MGAEDNGADVRLKMMWRGALTPGDIFLVFDAILVDGARPEGVVQPHFAVVTPVPLLRNPKLSRRRGVSSLAEKARVWQRRAERADGGEDTVDEGMWVKEETDVLVGVEDKGRGAGQEASRGRPAIRGGAQRQTGVSSAPRSCCPMVEGEGEAAGGFIGFGKPLSRGCQHRPTRGGNVGCPAVMAERANRNSTVRQGALRSTTHVPVRVYGRADQRRLRSARLYEKYGMDARTPEDPKQASATMRSKAALSLGNRCRAGSS